MDVHFNTLPELRNHTPSGFRIQSSAHVGRPEQGCANKNACMVFEMKRERGNMSASWGGYLRMDARGPGAIRIKNALPPLFVYEYLKHCVEHRTNAAQDIVVDLCCGWQSLTSLKPVREELGLHYIGVDIMGDRNRFLPIQARFKNKDGARVGGPRW